MKRLQDETDLVKERQKIIMALYHFTVKSNKKPNGQRIKALEHVDYINREGKYKGYDEKDDSMLENLITSEKRKDALNGSTHLLYSSPFGIITNTTQGISVAQSPSMETIAIALMVADETMHAPLIITGSDTFKAKCVIAAIQAKLPITFQNPQMQTALLQKKEELENERSKLQSETGVRFRRIRDFRKSNLNRHTKRLQETPSLAAIPHVHALPVGQLDASQDKQPSMLLQESESDKLVNRKSDTNADLRRSLQQTGRRRRIYRAFETNRRDRVEGTVRAIIKNIEKNMDKVYAESHVEYINRQKAFAQKGGCIYSKSRLPAWASIVKTDEDGNKIRVPSPNVFFRVADNYSPAGDRTYKEVEFALQNELTLEQNLEIVDRFIEENLPDHYYNYAVHDKIGVMSNGTHNLHVHLMFSPRIIDEVELKQPRLRRTYFSYPLRKNAKDQSFEKKRNHGAPKDRKWDGDASFLPAVRASFARITNETLKKYGYSIRVDHRSLKVREKEARADGDTYLADLLKRIPEEHVSRMGMLKENDPAVQKIREYRKQKSKYRDLLFEAELLEKAIEEQDREQIHHEIDEDIHRIIDTEEYQKSELDANSLIGELRQNFLEVYQDYLTVRSQVLSGEEAYETARLEYMTETEKEAYQSLKKLKEDARNWQDFQDNLTEPESPAEFKTYQELKIALSSKLDILEKQQKQLQETVALADQRLDNPDIKKTIQEATHKILQGQKHQEYQLKAAERNLKTCIVTLSQALFDEADMNKDMYSCQEIYEDVRRAYYGCKKQAARLAQQAEWARKQFFTVERATKIAEDRYVHGAFKVLREDIRNYQKDEQRYSLKETEWKNAQRDLQVFFEEVKKNPALQPEYRNKESYTQSLASEITDWQKRRLKEKERIESVKNDLINRISTPQAKAKIQDIALGIMRKNKPNANRYAFLKKKLDNTLHLMNEKQIQMQKLYKLVQNDPKGNRVFRVERDKLPHPVSRREEPGIIAAALSGSAWHLPVVVTSQKEDDKGMRSNWAMLTEAAKEEEKNKAFWKLI